MGCSPNSRSYDLCGLSGLAKGYEQYRESLTTLRPTTEFGEPSSDDLSSEWESSSENDPSNVVLRDQVAFNLALNNRRRKFQCGLLPKEGQAKASSPQAATLTAQDPSKIKDDDEEDSINNRDTKPPQKPLKRVSHQVPEKRLLE